MRRLLLLVAALVVAITTVSYSGEYTMISVPKLRSTWFNDLETGIKKAGEDFGVNVYQQAPASADEAQQVRIIEDAITQGVNALLVVPNDANACVPAFARARSMGIPVITHESVGQPEADFNVEMVDNVGHGENIMKAMVEDLGTDEGEYAIFVGSLTVPAHNQWADAAIAYAKKNHPKLTLVADRFPVAEDRNAARQKTLELLMTYPELKGILSFGSQGAPGAGQALREKRMQNKVVVIATTSPKEAASFLKDGTINYTVLWSPADAGRAMVYLAKMLLDGKRDDIKQGLEIPGLGVPQIDGASILFNKPLLVDGSNCDQFDF